MATVTSMTCFRTMTLEEAVSLVVESKGAFEMT